MTYPGKRFQITSIVSSLVDFKTRADNMQQSILICTTISWQKETEKLLGHFHYYSSVFKNASDILKGLGVYKHVFLQCSSQKIIKKV